MNYSAVVFVISVAIAYIAWINNTNNDDNATSTSSNIIFQRTSSNFGIVQVIDYKPPDAPALRFLRSGGSIVGADFIDEEYDDQSAFLNFAALQMVVHHRPKPKRVLALGLGAATVVRFLRQSGIVVDVVEISPDIVEAAATHFKFNAENGSHGSLWIEDAQIFLGRSTTHKYDAVIHDLFNGLNPVQLLTEFIISKIKSDWLKPNGVLLVNFFGYHQRSSMGNVLSTAVQATLETVFAPPPVVRCYREIDPSMYPTYPANLIYIAWANPKNANTQGPPFTIPKTSDYISPPEMSTFWVQKHLHTFDVTSNLRPNSPNSKFAQNHSIVNSSLAMYLQAGKSIEEEYKQLVVSMYPPAEDWF